MNDAGSLPPRLQEIVEDFQLAEGREKLEMLLEYSERMPPLPPHLQAEAGQMEQVEECMSPVYVQAELKAGGLEFYFDVPPESPTVRGYAALMAEGINGASPRQVLQIPADFYHAMGLQEVLTSQRLNGISAILAHMKQIALKHVEHHGS
jgi:cysteine desulfuration protein SufE